MNKYNKKAVSFLTALLLAYSPVYTGISFTSNAVEQAAANEAFLSVPSGTTASNGMFTVTFDPTTTKVTEITPGDMFTGIMTSSSIKDGKITFAFVNTKPMDISGDIIKISYTSAESSPAFTLKVNELVTLDEAGNELKVASDSLKINTSETVSTAKEIFLTVPEGTTASNGMFTVSFDPTNTTVTEVTPGDMFEGVMTSSSVKEGKVTFAFVTTKPMDISGKIMKISYTTTSDTPSFTLKINELVTLDEAGNEHDVAGDSIKTGDDEEGSEVQNYRLSLSSEADTATNIVKVRADIPAGTGVTNGLLNLSFDPSEVSVSNIKACGALSEAMIETNISENNAKIVFISTKPINNESWFEFDITGKKDVLTKISFSAGEFYKIDASGNFEEIPVISSEATLKAQPAKEDTKDKPKLELKTDINDSDKAHTIRASAVIPAGTDVTNGILLIGFSSSEISVSDITINGGLKNAMTETNISDGVAKIAFISSKPITDESIIEFTITGNTDAVTKISFSTDEFYITDSNNQLNAVEVIPAEASVHVLPESTDVSDPGQYDVSNDGIVNAYDMIVLRKIILADPSLSVSITNADINNDGTVNVLDLTRLVNYILNNGQQ